VVLGNEVLDARPVRVFEHARAGALEEVGVAVDDAREVKQCRSRLRKTATVPRVLARFEQMRYSEGTPQGAAAVAAAAAASHGALASAQLKQGSTRTREQVIALIAKRAVVAAACGPCRGVTERGG
jgi:SAM-dependent MidA family methyltransferase